MVIPTFTLRALIVVVAVLALLIAALLYSTPRVAAVVINGTCLAVLIAACLMAGTPQPARSFWLGFVIACSGFLLLDMLSQHRLIHADLFTRTLVAGIDDWLPPIVHRGPAGRTQLFRNNGRFPIYYQTFGEDGERTGHGQMTV